MYTFKYKGICCGYPFELHRLVDAIQMNTHNICFYMYNENQKKTLCFKSVPLVLDSYLPTIFLVFLNKAHSAVIRSIR